MGKLFSLNDIEDTSDVNYETLAEEVSFPSISDEVDDHKHSLSLATEALKNASNELKLVRHINTSLNGKKLASVDYFTSLENYKPVLEVIASNLGNKLAIPSLEDFQNPYGAKASHEVAMEGLRDYVKKIWEKIKDIFVAFFKKITLFFRRVLKVDLELENYEEYLEVMIAKIKSKKPEISNSKEIIDSKLPSLLANPGMETITHDYILGTGEVKIKQLVHMINKVFNEGIGALAKNDFKQLSDSVNELVSAGFQKEKSLTEVTEKLDGIKRNAINAINKLFIHEVRSIRDLPETVYNDVYYHLDKNEETSFRATCLIDSNNSHELLPKNFNCYMITSAESKLFIASSTENNSFVQNKIYPIPNANNLVTFYEFYRKFSKEVNLKKLDNSLKLLDKHIDDLVNCMRGKYMKLLDELSVVDKSDEGSKFMAAILALKTYMKSDPVNNIPDASDVFSEVRYIGKLIDDSQEADAIDDIYAAYKGRESEFIGNVTRLTGSTITAGTSSNYYEDDRKQLLKQYEELQKFLLNYLNNVQVMLKDISVNMAGTYTELRYELAKYLYKSASLYKV